MFCACEYTAMQFQYLPSNVTPVFYSTLLHVSAVSTGHHHIYTYMYTYVLYDVQRDAVDWELLCRLYICERHYKALKKYHYKIGIYLFNFRLICHCVDCGSWIVYSHSVNESVNIIAFSKVYATVSKWMWKSLITGCTVHTNSNSTWSMNTKR
jgi:hypothetical protein